MGFIKDNLYFTLLIIPLITGVLVHYIPIWIEKIKANKSINNRNPWVYFDLHCNTELHAEFYCQLFQKNNDIKRGEEWYKPLGEALKLTELKPNRWGIKASAIRDILKRDSDPFKFYCLVPLDEVDLYYGCLAKSGFTITGCGHVSPLEKDKWMIWFLVDREHHHKNIQSISRINHKL